MRILITAPPLADVLSPGGIYKVIRETAKHLSKRGHDVTVLQLNPLNRPNEEFYEGFRIIRVNSKHFYGLSFGMYSYLKKHFNELSPDVVHVHGYHNLLAPEIIYTIKRLKPNTRIIFSPHMDISRSTIVGRLLWKPYNYFIRHAISKRIDHLVVASNFEASIIKNEVGINPDKISIIPHGVDIIDTKKSQKQRDSIHILYSGYLVERKKVSYILKSIHSLVYDVGESNITLTIIGEGPEKNKLIKLAKELKIEDKIEWLSFLPREHLRKKLKEADVFLLLSESEAYGIVVAEALALGTPVIVTKRAALVEFLTEPGCFGVNYPPNPREVAELISKLANSQAKVGPFSKKIRTWSEVVEEYDMIYKRILGQRRQ